jgi:hypothetical protein
MNTLAKAPLGSSHGFGYVDPGYRHVAKTARPGPILKVGAADCGSRSTIDMDR